MFETKAEILEALEMPDDRFRAECMGRAKQIWRDRGDDLIGMAMLGYSNVCRNQCLYCGMRAANTAVRRFRLMPEEALELVKAAGRKGFGRLFLIAGEDPGYGFERLLELVEGAVRLGFRLSLACGEFEPAQYRELAAAGAREYVLKFEMSDPAEFDRLNPSTTFQKRMAAIEAVRASGMELASGNIIGYPGHTPDQMAEDILLMKRLEISWAPVVPYMPAVHTPLALEGGRGDVELALREIAILRILMPGINITAGQPGRDLAKGFADEEGNLNALQAGANLLFADLLPAAQAREFHVIDDRIVLGLEHMRRMAERAGMRLRLDRGEE